MWCENTYDEAGRITEICIETASSISYNCYGNAIGKLIVASPTGYKMGDSTRETFEAVVNDLGKHNVRELKSINDYIHDDEFMVAMKCGPVDYHFIRLTDNGWYNKSGKKWIIYTTKYGNKRYLVCAVGEK